MPALATAKIQALSPAVLNELAMAQSQSSDAPSILVQNHNYVEGSLDERMNNVNVAFNEWCRHADRGDDWCYWWTCLLAIYDDYLLYGVCSRGVWSYYKLDYAVDADGAVSIPTKAFGAEINVKLVYEVLGMDEETSEGESAEQSGFIQGMLNDQVEAFYQAKWTKAKRDAHPEADFGDPKGRKYPIKDQDDVDSAAKLIGKAANPAAVKKRVIAIAKRKGLSIPDAWKDNNVKEKQNYADPAGFKGAEPSATASAGAADDPVGNTTSLTADIVSAPVEHSDDNPKINVTTATAGDEKPVEVSIDADKSVPVEHSGDEGATKGGDADDTDDGEVEDEMADTAEGLKNVPSDTNYDKLNAEVIPAKQTKTSPIIQSSSKGRDGTSFSTILKLEQSENAATKKKVLKIQGIATRADIINAEGVVYPLPVWEKNLQSMNELATAGKFLGKLEHPDQEQGLVDTAIKFNKFWLQGSDVYFDADVVPTEPYGKNLQALIEAGVQIDMSTRGYGRVEPGTWRGQSVKLIQDDFVCIGVDAVYMGASVGSGITEAVLQSAKPNKDKPLSKAEAQAQALRDKVVLEQGVKDLVLMSKLTEVGRTAYTKALQSATSVEGLFELSETVLPHLQTAFGVVSEEQVQSSTWAPTFINKQSDADTAPQTVGQLIDRLVADLPDSYGYTTAHGGSECQSHFRSPRAACKRLMVNMAQEQTATFNGRAAIMSLLALEQGRVEQAGDIMSQSLATGATTAAANADPSGAPLSAPLIFPLVRRVFPMYIMNEVAAIQPMDRPEGKIFYLDAYRTLDPTTGNVDARIDLNTSSSPFNSSYADNATEGAAAQLIRLKLASITVSAYTKKLGANWSIEEMQDLRAYHGLDAAQELMGSVAREMALEWNKTVLDDMAAQATAGALSYGTLAPSTGFPNQTDWDGYIWNYIQKLDNIIFSKRNGPMTHIVAGIDAALALAKSMRGTFSIGGENGGEMEEKFPGTTYFGVINAPNGGRYKVFKTNFWGSGTVNGKIILGLRRGTEWSDTPYVWAPYTDYVTPILTDPSDFSQKQGIVSRAAKQVVVGDAMATLTVNTGSQGAVL